MPMPTAYAVDPMKEPPKLQLQPHHQQQLYLTYQHTTLGGQGQQPQLNLCDMLDGGICPQPPMPASSGQHSIYASLRSQRELTPMLMEFCPAPTGPAQCSPAAAALQNNGGCLGNEECELNPTAGAATPRLQQRNGDLPEQVETESLYSGFTSQQQQQQQPLQPLQPNQDNHHQHYQTPTTGRSAATLDSSRRHHKRRRRQQGGQGTPTFARDQQQQHQQPTQPISPMVQDQQQLQQHSQTPPPVPKHRRINGQIYARPSDLHVLGSVGPTPTSVAQSQRHRYTMGAGGYSPQPHAATKLQQQRGQAEGSAPPAYTMGLQYNV